MNARGRGWVEPLEQPVQPIAPAPLAAGKQALAQLVAALRSGEEPFGERAQVEAGSSGDDGQATARGYLPQCGARLAAVLAAVKG